MKYSLADKLALIYTSAGSQRKVASFTGLSHQQVGRILHKDAEGQNLAHYESDPEIVAAVDTAFAIHKDVARQVAKQQDIPFNAQAPVYSERAPLQHKGVLYKGKLVFRGTKAQVSRYIRGHSVNIRDEDGEIVKTFKAPAEYVGKMAPAKLLGERVLAQHMHWMSDDIKAEYVKKMQKSKRVFKASASSIVYLPEYMKTAKVRIEKFLSKGNLPSSEQLHAEEQLRNLLKDYRKEGDEQKLARVYTPSTVMDSRFPSKAVSNDMLSKLEQRHTPAVGMPGTVRGDQMILQLRTQNEPKRSKRTTARTNRTRPHKN